ncbi:MAG: hypothetical protein ACKVX7_08625 [Planctomycetota bacterium]
MIPALLVLLPVPVVGWCIVRLLLGRARGAAERATHMALGWGVGAGVCALNYYVWLRTDPDSGAGFVLGEIVILGVLAAFLGSIAHAKKKREVSTATPIEIEVVSPKRGARAATLLLTALLALAAYASWRQFTCALAASPHGSYDAWSVYNLKARLMFRGGDDWHHALSAVNPHPDYPLLLPALVARSWSLLGADLQVVPQLIAFIYLVTTALLLVAALTRHATVASGLLAGSVLLATPLFSIHAASLFADGPLAWAFLGVAVLLARHGSDGACAAPVKNSLLLAGLIAAIAAWTKNEGALFAGAAGAVLCCVRLGATTRRCALGWYTLGAAPLLLLLVHFKLTAPASTTGLAPFSSELVARLANPARYWIVVQAVAFHSWVVMPAVALGLYAWTNGLRREAALRRPLLVCGLTLGLTLVGYLLAYVVASGDLAGMVSRSSRRLLLQVWPAALWLVFLGTQPLFAWAVSPRPALTSEPNLTPDERVRSAIC